MRSSSLFLPVQLKLHKLAFIFIVTSKRPFCNRHFVPFLVRSIVETSRAAKSRRRIYRMCDTMREMHTHARASRVRLYACSMYTFRRSSEGTTSGNVAYTYIRAHVTRARAQHIYINMRILHIRICMRTRARAHIYTRARRLSDSAAPTARSHRLFEATAGARNERVCRNTRRSRRTDYEPRDLSAPQDTSSRTHLFRARARARTRARSRDREFRPVTQESRPRLVHACFSGAQDRGYRIWIV